MTVRKFRRLSALFGAIVVSLFLENISIASATTTSAPSSATHKQFARELESLFGATVKTKNGEMRVRQRKDLEGRVRKQIISGPGFSEIQLDQDGDGTVDFLEVTRGVKTVSVSHPNRGRFLRMTTAERTTKGLREAVYLLSLDGRSYNLLKTRMTDKNFRLNKDSETGSDFEAVDSGSPTESVPSSVSADVVPEISAASSRSIGIEVEDQWIKEQEKFFGDAFVCKAEPGKLAELQREWWKVLKYDVDERTDKLIDKLKSSKMFDDNCKAPARKKDFDKMVNGLAIVMLSSSIGQPLSTDKTRGRFLRCLEQSGLGITVARMEKSFLASLDDPYRTTAPIRCDWRPGAKGASTPGSTANGQVTVHLCAADEGKGTSKEGAGNNYQNMLFHEFMHVGGYNIEKNRDEEEKLVHEAEACCGDPTTNRPAACQRLDKLVASQKRYNEIETHLARVDDGIRPIRTELELLFSPNSGNLLFRKFISELDEYRKGSPPKGEFETGLISDVEYSKCLTNSSDAECRARWTDSIRKHADAFFGKQCQLLVSGAERSKCKQVTSVMKDDLAKSIAGSMIGRSWTPSPTIPPEDNGKPCPPTVARSGSLNSKPMFVDISNLLFGAEVHALDACVPGTIDVPYCPPVDDLPPQGEPPPIRNPYVGVEPGGSEIDPKKVPLPVGDIVVDTGRGPDSSVGSGSSGRDTGSSDRDYSPLPVTRVDSPSGGRNYAEDRYRRATDLVGGTSRVFDRARNAILPKAVASERDAKSSSGRLGPGVEFIVYKPEEPRDLKVKLENPFSSNRAIASISALSLGKSGIAAAGGGAGAVGSDGPNAAGLEKNISDKDGATKLDTQKAAAKGGGRGGLVTSTSTSTSSSIHNSKANQVGGLGNGGSDLLAGLFTLPYRQIEERLKRLDVVEALIAKKISIQDAKGRVLGSKRATEKYQFNGLDRPLSKQSKR